MVEDDIRHSYQTLPFLYTSIYNVIAWQSTRCLHRYKDQEFSRRRYVPILGPQNDMVEGMHPYQPFFQMEASHRQRYVVA
jgi:hypothetical protein